MHDGKQYQIVRLEVESRTAYATTFDGNYYTMPGANTEIRVIHKQRDCKYHRLLITFGDVNVEDVIFMYKKLQFHNHQNLGCEQLRKPLCKDYDTESVWFQIPNNVVSVYRRLIMEGQSGQIVVNNHFEGMCHALKHATMMLTMTEQEDIGVTTSANVFDLTENFVEDVHLFIYDKYIGGLSYAEKAYELIPTIIENAIELVKGCNCEKGCVACVGDYMLDKKIVLWGLNNLLEEVEAPAEMKTAEYAKRTFIKKEFAFKELPMRWEEFCQYLLEQGEKMASFLSQIKEVAIRNHSFVLMLNNPFYKEWVMEETNRRSISNIITFYTDAPITIKVEVEMKELSESRVETREKIQRRYEKLREE